MTLSRRKGQSWRSLGLLLGIIVAMVGLLLALSVVYLQHQHVFVGGDINAGFYNRAVALAEAARHSPIAAIRQLARFANDNYNSYSSLPLLPILLLLGDRYEAYVASLLIGYVVPLNLTLAAIATRLLPGRSPAETQVVFIFALVLASLFAPNLITVLNGYPDIGAALLVTLAMAILVWPLGQRFDDRTLDRLLPHRRQVLGVGILWGGAVLIRRHFAYADVALLVALLVQGAIGLYYRMARGPGTGKWRSVQQFGLRLAGALGCSLGLLLLLAPLFTQRAFTTDYDSLYSSWSRPLGETVTYYGRLYGWGIWGLAIAGLGLGIAQRMVAVPVALFVSVFGLTSIAIWLLKLRYTEIFYALHIMPMVVLGLISLGGVLQSWIRRWTGWSPGLGLGFLVLVLGVNSGACLLPIGAATFPGRTLLAANYPPLVRDNYDEVVHLTQFLRQLAPNREPILVLPNGALAEHVIRAAERTIYGADRQILSLWEGAAIDSSGFYPLRELLQAQYVVLTQPFVAWNQGEQEIAHLMNQIFLEEWELTRDFERLPEVFDLKNGITTVVYRRLQPTPIDRAVRTLYTMQSRIDKSLGNQLNWITASSPFRSQIQPNATQTYTLNVKRFRSDEPLTDAADPTKSFLYLGPLALPATVQARVTVPDRCSQATLQVSLLNTDGSVLARSAVVDVKQQSSVQLTIDDPQINNPQTNNPQTNDPQTDQVQTNSVQPAPSQTDENHYLLLQLRNPDWQSGLDDRCPLTVTDLSVQPG